MGVERRILEESWERSIRLKQAQKVIDMYHMAPAKNEVLSDFSSITAGIRKNIPGLALSELRPGSGLASSEQRPATGSNLSSRPPTGSARRVPLLGAAAS